MQCHSCNRDISATAKFCPKCGTSTADVPYVPGASLGIPDPAAPPQFTPPLQRSIVAGDNYLLLINGQQSGPFTINQMKSMWHSGTINNGTYYWQAGMTEWQSLSNLRHFLDLPAANTFAGAAVNQIGQPVYPMQQFASNKSRVAFILFGLFLGCFGVHNFYAGYSGKGIAQLLITLLLGWVFGLGIIITGIWALIEIIVVSTDSQGLRMN